MHERVGKLEAAGVITGYHAAVAPGGPRLLHGRDHLDVPDRRVARPHAVGEHGRGRGHRRRHRRRRGLWFVAGEEALILKVRVPDVGALEKVIRRLNDIPGVGHTRTTVVLSTRFEGRVRSAHLTDEGAARARTYA